MKLNTNMKTKTNTNTNIADIKQILELGRKIYPINLNCDNKLDNIYKIDNWGETFYHIKSGKLKERFIELTKKSEYAEFFKGLNYEYGLNNYNKDLKIAFNIYKTAADYSLDCMAMFRMYHIYKKDFKKFNIDKRERILEKYYLFKCFSYLRYPIMKRSQNMFNRFDITLEVLIHFAEEDLARDKFHKFIEHIKKYYALYNINIKDIDFIENIVDIKIKSYDEEDISEELIKLIDLAHENKNNLEIPYKYICLNKFLDDEFREEEFKKLYEQKYYRSYVDYALFLYSKKRNNEALKILLEAKTNGIISAGFIYFDTLLDGNGFKFLIDSSLNFNPECELYKIFMILIDDIIIESVYSIYEYIFLLKLCFKHYNLENMINIYFYDYTQEIIKFLYKITSEPDINKGKKLVEKYFCDEDNFKEYNLAYGVAKFYGIKNILQKDLDKAYKHIKIAYECNSGPSYKRFCYFYLYKISKIFHKEKKMEKDPKSKKETLLVTDTKLKNMQSKLFLDYKKSLDDNINDLSSSYFYYLSRLYNKKIGNSGDKMMEYICIKKAIDYRNNTPGAGSIISFYRKYKAKVLLEKNKNECIYIFSHSLNKKDSEGYGENGDICPICFENKRNTISLPCKHLFCDECSNKMEKCAICRKSIMVRFRLDNI